MNGKLILFDLDGTLVELWDVHVKVFAKVFEELYGLPNINFREIGYTSGTSNEYNVWEVLKHLGHSDNFIGKKINKVDEILKKYYPRTIKKGRIKILPGVNNLLDVLKRKGIPMGLVTGNRLFVANAILDKAELDDYFMFKITADDTKDREERLKIAVTKSRKLFSRPKIYFFDDAASSIAASRKVGIKSVAVATGETSDKLRAAKPDYIFGDLKNTAEILKIIEL